MAHEEHDYIENPERLTGFTVRAVDGRLGRVVEATEHGLLIRTGRVGRRRLAVPARAVDAVDLSGREILLNRTRRQAKRFPQPTGGGRGGPRGWYVPPAARDAGNTVPYAVPGPPVTPDQAPDAPG